MGFGALGIRPEDNVQANFNDKISFNGVRHSIRLPWKVTNYAKSVIRLKSLLSKLRKEPAILNEYEAIIKEQLNLGIIKKVMSLEPEKEKVNYLPRKLNCLHFFQSFSKPLAIQFFFRFMLRGIAMTSDIEKAFLNIDVDERDRDCSKVFLARGSLRQ